MCSDKVKVTKLRQKHNTWVHILKMYRSHLFGSRFEQLEASYQGLAPLDGTLILAQDALQLGILAVGYLCLKLVQQLFLALQHLHQCVAR